MAGFGGAVKLTGESEYRKALSQITQSLKVVSAEMKATSTGFDAGAKSEADLADSAEQLSRALDVQKSALSTLKGQLATMKDEYSKTGAVHENLVNEYESEKAKLDEIGRTLGTSSQEYKNQEKIVNDLAQEVAKSQKSYDAQGKAINDLTIKTANAETQANKTAKTINDLGETTEESGEKAEESSKGWTIMGQVLANLATEAIKVAIDGAKKLGGAFVDAGKQALDGYAQFEQLEGGVKKIFGEDMAKDVVANANNAFKTAGMSANEYMETVTGFSATLMQGLGSDTSKATEYADKAIRNMSDNANTFGTDMGMIQNAYQGFAKGNFTMLDNLKLGYGGTQAEMARLINESGVLGDSMTVTAKTVKDVPFYQMIEAIDKTQERMGIMGTTAKEASGTIEGSTGSMKSAWENLMTGMADENANMETLTKNFIGTLVTEDGKGGVIGTIIPRVSKVITGMSQAITTMLPQLINIIVPIIQENLPVIMGAIQDALTAIVAMIPQIMPVLTSLIPQLLETFLTMMPEIINAGIQIITSLIEGITLAIPQLVAMLPQIVEAFVSVVLTNLPTIINAGLNLILALVQGLSQAIPQLISYLPNIIIAIVRTLTQNLPQIIQTAIKIIGAMVQGLIQAIPQLIAVVPKLISALVNTLASNLPKILKAGTDILKSLVQGIGQKISDLKEKAKEVGQAFVDKVKEFPSKVISIGRNLVEGIWSGISNGLGWIKGKIRGWVGNVTSFLKGLFGIHSPSRLFRDEIGKNLALGIGYGFTDEMKNVEKMMGDAMPTTFDMSATVNGARYANDNMVGAFKEALSQVKIVLDDEVAGEFVDNTVTRLIYT